MLRSTRLFLVAAVAIAASLLSALPAIANDELRPLVQALADGKFDDKAEAIQALAATGDTAVAPILEAMGEGLLYQRKSDDLVVIAEKNKRELTLFDPLTGEELETVKSRAAKKVKVNNRLRRQISGTLGSLPS